MNGWTWQRTATIGIFVCGACIAMLLEEHTLAATLVGLCGGLAIPPMTLPTNPTRPQLPPPSDGDGDEK